MSKTNGGCSEAPLQRKSRMSLVVLQVSTVGIGSKAWMITVAVTNLRRKYRLW
jgi:hypothetical protein